MLIALFELAGALFFGSGSAGGGLEETLYGMCGDRHGTFPPKRSLDGAPPSSGKLEVLMDWRGRGLRQFPRPRWGHEVPWLLEWATMDFATNGRGC